MPGPLSNAHAITKLPAQDLERARAFYRDKLGLEPLEERDGGLRYMCGATEFHIFASAGEASGASTQMSFEVFTRFDIPGFEARGDAIVVPGNYPSKGTGELGAFFYDSEGNLLGLAQPTG